MSMHGVQWEAVIDSIGLPSMILDPHHTVLQTNKITDSLLGKSVKEVQGEKCYRLFHGTETPPERCPLIRMLSSGQFEKGEMHIETLGSEFLVSCNPLFSNGGSIRKILHIATDIGHYKMSLALLEEEKEKYRSLIESSDDSIYLVDRNYRYLFINKKHLARIGVPDNNFTRGLAFHEFHSSEETETFIEKIDRVFRTGESHHYEYLSQRDGRHFLQSFSPVRNKGGETVAVTVISKDISRLKQMEEALRSMSFTDELTGVYNRRGFITLSSQQIKVADRLNRGILLLFADIDNLKQINDTYGHHTGDRVLTETADLFRELFRGSDIIARIGGDEFVVFSIESTDISVESINMRLRDCLKAYNTKKDKPYTLEISTGIIYYEAGSSISIDDMLIRADRMMYEQKKKNRKS